MLPRGIWRDRCTARRVGGNCRWTVTSVRTAARRSAGRARPAVHRSRKESRSAAGAEPAWPVPRLDRPPAAPTTSPWGRPTPRSRWQSAACAQSCSSISSASRRWPSNVTRRRFASSSPGTSTLPRPSSAASGASSRSSSATPSWPSGEHLWPLRGTQSGRCGPPSTSCGRSPISAGKPACRS